MAEEKSELSVVKSIAYDVGAAGVAAAVINAFIYPMERIRSASKIQRRQQKQHHGPNGESARINVPALASKPSWLWHGNVSTTFRFCTTSAFLMALKNQYRRLLVTPETPPRGASWWYANIAAGTLAGVTWLALTYPPLQRDMLIHQDNLRCSKTGEAPRYEQRTFQEIVAKDGIGILYRRFGLICSGAIVFYGLSFGLYDSLKPRRKRDSFIDRLFLGWGTSLIAYFSAHPLEMLRTYAEKMDSKSSYHALTSMIKRKELLILTRGFSLGIFRPLRIGCLLAGFDQMMPLMFPKQQ